MSPQGFYPLQLCAGCESAVPRPPPNPCALPRAPTNRKESVETFSPPPCHGPIPPWILLPLTSSPLVQPVQELEFPPSSPSKTKPNGPSMLCVSTVQKHGSAQGPSPSRHAPGSKPGIKAGQEDGGIWRRAADLGTILGVTKGSVAGSVLLASGRIGSAGLSRSHWSLAYPPGPPAYCCLPPEAGAHAQGSPRGEAPDGGGPLKTSRPEVGVVLSPRFAAWGRV